MAFTAELAEELINACIEAEFVEQKDVPDDEEAFIEKAQELYEMAIVARDDHGLDTEEIAEIIEMGEAAQKSKPKGKPAAKKAAPKKRGKAAPEPEPEEEDDDDEEEEVVALEEPWEDYDSDKIADIVEGIKVWGEDGELDDIKTVLDYESANKNRAKIVKAAEAFLDSDDESDEDDDEDAEVEEEPDEAETDEDEAEGELEEPFEGYDELSVKEVKEALDEFAESDEYDNEQKSTVYEEVSEYENAKEKPRVSIVKHATKLFEALVEVPEDEAEEVDADEVEEPENQDSAPKKAKGKKSAPKVDADVEVNPDLGEDDEDYADLVTFVTDKIESENLHVPGEIEDEAIELPFNLNDVTESDLAGYHSAFAAYAYRASHLLTIEEATATKCRQAADEIVEIYIAESDSSATVAHVKAVAEQNDEVKKWRRRQRHHAILADSLRRKRDDYRGQVEFLSRQITARDDQWRHAGQETGTDTVTKPKLGGKPKARPGK